LEYFQSAEEAKCKFFSEITGADNYVGAAYLARYRPQVERFAELMARALMDWQAFDKHCKGDEKRERIACMLFCAISLHTQSMRLFLAGHFVAAGNLSRQVLEATAMALLGSGKTLSNLDRFIAGTYGTNGAVRDVWRNRKVLGLQDEGAKALLEAEQFYHEFSHFSLPTIATTMRLLEPGVYLGASFDEGKAEDYDGELRRNLRVAELFPNFFDAVAFNLMKW
jgi:hypothetical protein